MVWIVLDVCDYLIAFGVINAAGSALPNRPEIQLNVNPACARKLATPVSDCREYLPVGDVSFDCHNRTLASALAP